MKYIAIAILSLFVVFNVQAQQDRVNDFRQIEWGSHIDSIYRYGDKLEFVKVDDKNKNGYGNAFYLENDVKEIGSVETNKILYVFNDEDRFKKVIIEGDKSELEEMAFILDYKFGRHGASEKIDNVKYHNWVVQDVSFTLSEFEARDWKLVIESDWERAAMYKANTTVDDF